METGRLNGNAITEVMKEKTMTYGALAGALGVSPSLVRQMEEGYLPVRGRIEILTRLAGIRGSSVGALFIPASRAKETA